jgi:hypothetical protein
MQPFVRSNSPVAERDQRIGMTGFEEFKFGESPFATADSEAGLEETGALQTPMLPTITAASDVGKTTVQRKMASPSATPVGPTTPAAPSLIGVDARRKGDLQPARQRAHQDAVPPSDATREHEPIPGRSQTRSASRGARGMGYGVVRTRSLQQARQAGSNFLEPLPYALAEHIEQTPTGSSMSTADAEEWSIFSTDATREHEPIPGSSQTRSASRGVGYGVVRTRSLQQARQADSNFLEPLPYALAEHIEQTPTGSSMSTAGTGEGPRLVIGRINVEVVPPPVVQPSTAAPRPGPVTAASVSVIGPLGGGVRPSLRLSLRHR